MSPTYDADDRSADVAQAALHDFSNLLSVIAAQSDVLLSRLRPDERDRRSAEAIRKAAEFGATLTRTLLGSRQYDLSWAVVSLNLAVAAAARMLHPSLAEGVDLVTRLDPALGRTWARGTEIERVVVSLAVTAQNAIPSGGRLTLETTNVDIEPSQSGSPTEPPPGSYVMFALVATGPDTEPRQRRLGARKGKDTGPALAARAIVTQHGGYITVSGGEGESSTFRVYLPRLREVEIMEQHAGHARQRHDETILLVEDETNVRDLVREALELGGYTVLQARDTDDALAVAKEYPGPIHLMISDVLMPGLSQQDFLRELAGRRPGIKVLYVSGHTEEEIEERSGPLPGPLLRKPFPLRVLAQKVRELLDSP